MTTLDAMKLTILFGAAVHIYLVVFYFVSSRKRMHNSFPLLIISTVLSLLYAALTSASYFVEMPQELATHLYRYGLFIFFPAALFGLLGIRSLVKAYIDAASGDTPGDQSTSDGWGN